MAIKAPKGTKDVLLKDSYKWQYIEKKWAEICSEYGFREIRTPVFEATELFSRGIGDTTGTIEKGKCADKGAFLLLLRSGGF